MLLWRTGSHPGRGGGGGGEAESWTKIWSCWRKLTGQLYLPSLFYHLGSFLCLRESQGRRWEDVEKGTEEGRRRRSKLTLSLPPSLPPFPSLSPCQTPDADDDGEIVLGGSSEDGDQEDEEDEMDAQDEDEDDDDGEEEDYEDYGGDDGELPALHFRFEVLVH